MADHTRHQKKIIERYYDRRDEIMLSKLAECITELALATTDRERDRIWKRVATAMTNLKVPASTADHILEKRDPAVLARHLTKWLMQAQRKG